MPKKLDPSALSDFQPREPKTKPNVSVPSPPEPTPQKGWPSREVRREEVGQFTVRAPAATIARFKAICKADRRTYADMLDILMNNFEQQV